MNAQELETFNALAEESLRTNESAGQILAETVRDTSIMFRHESGCSAQPQCSCSFARMNFEELSALDAAAQSGLDGLGTKSTVRISLSMQENHVLSNLASFFGIVTAGTE